MTLNSGDDACSPVRQIFDVATAELATSSDESYRDSTRGRLFLTGNLTATEVKWKQGGRKLLTSLLPFVWFTLKCTVQSHLSCPTDSFDLQFITIIFMSYESLLLLFKFLCFS